MKKLLIPILSILTLCLPSGCGKSMPSGQLLSLDYTRTGTVDGYEYEGHVVTDSNDTYIIRAMTEYYGPLYEKKADAETIGRLRDIIEREKIYAYDSDYQPTTEVHDGYSWHFRATFTGGDVIESSGNNAWPDGGGLGYIHAYLIKLVEGGTQLDSDSVRTPSRTEGAD